MRILSQDGRISLNFENAILFVDSNSILAMNEKCGKKFLLGIYESEKRASEVFADIHNAYAPVYSISSGFSEKEVREICIQSENIVAKNVIGIPYDSSITTYSEYIYMMPEV